MLDDGQMRQLAYRLKYTLETDSLAVSLGNLLFAASPSLINLMAGDVHPVRYRTPIVTCALVMTTPSNVIAND